MARFVIIDNWLDSVGGHNYQYAVEILQDAAAAGWKPILATAQSFSERDSLPSDWLIRPLFRYPWNRTHTIGVDGKRNKPIDLEGHLLPCPTIKSGRSRRVAPAVGFDLIRRRDRRRRIEAFRDACSQLFDEIGFCDEDLIFFPSVSDFDFLGFASFLAANPASETLDWHVQFHYDIFDGRPPDYAAQESRREILQRQFSHALSRIPRHRLHFFATTPQIAEQYNQLRVGHFQPLPYPTSKPSPTRKTPRAQHNQPLRVTMAGGARREKGKHGLAELLKRIHNDSQPGRKVQLWLQGDPKLIFKNLSKLPTNTITQGHVDACYEETIVVIKHPLARNDYLTLIGKSDIALLPYNNSRYHARASGVLVEMLAARVPVIVPAGCWLAAQISDSIYEYLDTLRIENSYRHQIVDPEWIDPTTAEAKGLSADETKKPFCFDGSEQPAISEIPVTGHANEMLVSFQWREPHPGYFVRLQVEQIDAGGVQLTRPWESVLGERKTEGPISTLIHLSPHAKQIRLTLKNAYHNDTITMSDAEIRFFHGPPEGTPAAAVGLIATDMDQIPELLGEMVRYYDHYCHTVTEFATIWRKNHAPRRTVEILTTKLCEKKATTNAA